MQDIHATHRLPRGERGRGDARRPLAIVPSAARRRVLLLPAVLLLLTAPPAAAVDYSIFCATGSSASTGDPDDGEHRDLPPVKTIADVTETLPDVTPVASTDLSPRSPACPRGSAGRLPWLRRADLCGPVSLWSLLRTWFLHR